MNSEIIRKVLRSLNNLVATGEKLKETKNFNSEFESYYKYAQSIKVYLLNQTQDAFILKQLSELPEDKN